MFKDELDSKKSYSEVVYGRYRKLENKFDEAIQDEKCEDAVRSKDLVRRAETEMTRLRSPLIVAIMIFRQQTTNMYNDNEQHSQDVNDPTNPRNVHDIYDVVFLARTEPYLHRSGREDIEVDRGRMKKTKTRI